MPALALTTSRKAGPVATESTTGLLFWEALEVTKVREVGGREGALRSGGCCRVTGSAESGMVLRAITAAKTISGSAVTSKV